METMAETLAGVDRQAVQPPPQLPSSDPLAPRPHRQGPTGKKMPDVGAGLLPDDDGSSEATSRPTFRRARASSSPKPKPGPSTLPDDDDIIQVRGELAAMLAVVGMFVGMAMPVTGITLVMRAEVTSRMRSWPSPRLTRNCLSVFNGCSPLASTRSWARRSRPL